jgi:hypothetical protein
LARRERIATAGGQLLSAAFQLIGELLPAEPPSPVMREVAGKVQASLDDCVDRDDRGKPTLTVTSPTMPPSTVSPRH